MQLYRPPPLPPISELARPELKLAGAQAAPSSLQPLAFVPAACTCIIRINALLMPSLLAPGLRIDAEIFGSSRMGYSTGDVLPQSPCTWFAYHDLSINGP